MHSPSLLILDCDGVLVDSERIAVRVEAAALGRLGWTVTEAEIVQQFVGHPRDAMAQAIEARFGRAPGPEWEAELARAYRAGLEAGLRPVDGIVEALDAITTPTCVASNSGHAWLDHVLRLAGLHERFAGRIFSAEDVARPKPAPDLFLHAAATLGVAPPEAVVVEDSPAGVAAACAAGMRVLGYAGGLVTADRLGAADLVFHDMRELPALLGG